MLLNLRDALERLVTRQHAVLREIAVALTEDARGDTTEQDGSMEEARNLAPPPSPKPVTRSQRPAQERRARRLARYEDVRRLRAAGTSVRAIADQVGLNRQTVQRFANAETFPERQVRAPYPSIADPYEVYLRQ